MGNLFGSRPRPPAPTPQPVIDQRKELEEQEKKAEAEERKRKEKIASRARARRLAQRNPFITERSTGSARGNQSILNPDQQTLGYARNVRRA